MSCPHCGALLTGDEQFCRACGKPLTQQETDELGLHIVAGPGVGRSYDLGDATSIGRSVDNDFRLFDPEASREHAAIYRYAQGYAINDLGSANGTYLNEVRVTGAAWIKGGDVIRMGAVQMQVTSPGMPVVKRPGYAPATTYPADEEIEPSAGLSLDELPAWLLWALMGFGALLAASGVVGLVVMLSR